MHSFTHPSTDTHAHAHTISSSRQIQLDGDDDVMIYVCYFIIIMLTASFLLPNESVSVFVSQCLMQYDYLTHTDSKTLTDSKSDRFARLRGDISVR